MIYKIFKVPYKTLVRKRKGRGGNIVLSSISYVCRPSSHASYMVFNGSRCYLSHFMLLSVENISIP